MPWEEINLETHECQRPEYEPELKVQGTGSIWACHLCFKRWKLISYASVPVRWELMAKDAVHARYR